MVERYRIDVYQDNTFSDPYFLKVLDDEGEFILYEDVKDALCMLDPPTTPTYTIYDGCASRGFCYKCEVYVGHGPCFCMGGKCPLCKSHVYPRTEPKKDGTYDYFYNEKKIEPAVYKAQS